MSDFSLQNLNKILENYTYDTTEAWNAEDIQIPFAIKASDYLAYAYDDFKIIDNHHLVNCLSNIKRALDCQNDSLLLVFGLFKKSKDERWKFRDKVDILNRIGVISPSFLKKINISRNYLEHEYSIPDKKDVEDSLDIASLYLKYTEKYLKNIMTEIYIDNYFAKLDYRNQKIAFISLEYNEGGGHSIIEQIKCDSSEYLDYLKWYIAIMDKKERTPPPIYG